MASSVHHAAGPSKTEGSKLDLSAFFKEHGDEVKTWGMLSKYEESHEYLKQRMYVTLGLAAPHIGSTTKY